MSEAGSSEAMNYNSDDHLKRNAGNSGRNKRKQNANKPKKPASTKQANRPKLSPLHTHRLRNRNRLNEDMFTQEVGMDSLNLNTKDDQSIETGLSYDLRMSEHKCLWDENYPERPERFTLPLEKCREYKLIERCSFIPCRPATIEELSMQHSSEIIELISRTKDSSDPDQLEKLSSRFDAIYFHPSTYELALLCVGSTIDLVTNVVTGKLRNAMGLIRPPGHHAMKDEPCGYCYFNNVAIAAKHAVDNLGVKRVLIVDWDVHHGQATQYMFYNDPRVLYFSIHRYEHAEFWPNLRESNFDHIGTAAGKGFNFNVPLNKIGMGNSEYLAIFHQLLLPVAYEYSPELILVSAGYDAALGCFEGCMEVTPVCYSHLVNHLMPLANGKICVILEGGYCLKSLSESVALTLRGLLGDPCPVIGPIEEPCSSVVDSILNVISVQRPFWKCFQYQGVFSQSEDEVPPEIKRKRHIPEIKFLGITEKPMTYETRDCYPIQTNNEIKKFNKRLDYLNRTTSLTVPFKRTCLVYDERMLLHKNYSEPGHPERPDRVSYTYALMKELKIIERCYIIKPRLAKEEELISLHSKSHIHAMKETRSMKQKDLNIYQEQFQSIYFCQESYSSALLSAGCLFEVLEEVMRGRVVNGVALIRPPGHHAESDSPCGFCIFNNVALAAKLAINKYGLKRILIVDWDVHHGNGIQHMFEEDPRVVYISLHRYDKGSFFPCSDEANFDKIGKDAGVGFNINIPWNKGGIGDGDYISAFLHLILPVAYQYNPELILVSAGFDAAKGDPLGGCSLSPAAYGHMTHLLSSLATGRVILALEGGYNLNVLSHAVACCTRALLGDPPPRLSCGLHPCSSAVTSIANAMNVQKKYWSCLKYQVDLPLPTKNVEFLGSLSSSSLSLKSDLTSASNSSVESLTAGIRELAVAEFDSRASGSSESTSTIGVLPQLAYAVRPKLICPHLDSFNALPEKGIDIKVPCTVCGDKTENWLCLTCYEVHCGRYINQHMLFHNESTGHCIVLSFADLSVWCYGCEAYIENHVLTPVLAAAHLQKFGEDYPVFSLETNNDLKL